MLSSVSCNGGRCPLAQPTSLVLSTYSKIKYSEWPPESQQRCSSYLSPQKPSAGTPTSSSLKDQPPAASPHPKHAHGAWEASPFAHSTLPCFGMLRPSYSTSRKLAGLEHATIPQNPALLQSQHHSPCPAWTHHVQYRKQNRN